MEISKKIHQGIFLKRYKRFFADIDWNGQVVRAHVANTGSLKSCNQPGQPCLFTESDDPKRKLKFSLEMIQSPSESWVGINTSWPNALVKEALQEKLLPHWENFTEIKPEYKITAETRFDFAAFSGGDKENSKNSKTQKQKTHFIEVKNVTLAVGSQAQFPDAVTERGQKHLRELMRMIDEGHTAELVFVVQRNDVKSFAPADGIDPEYGRLLREAVKKGVQVTVLVTEWKQPIVKLGKKLLAVEL